ncbi:MAG TPA: acyltransferase [Candidatus Eisenbergiella merdigallinarum]|uniref:Acyltransferase n=1 Tax=Candidatus Eisenbergiella merdigallinarum TaxID=2838552 RepID=A0A9D2SD72_9FIRM|nr:acyltransferase [Candidatus Eisenbergiella merdigallinarum]
MRRYDNIQILRVLACLGVFVTHLAPKMGAEGWAASLANLGASGVYLFFLISGFLACAERTEGKRGIAVYYLRRIFRILPLYYAVILYNMALHGLILRDVPPDPDGLYWLRYFFCTSAFWPAPDNFWGNLSATWTIGLFLAFYLCAPLLKKAARGIKSAAALYLAAVALRYLWAGLGLSAYMMFFHYLHFFVLGMLVWHLHRQLGAIRGAAVLAGLAAAIGLMLTAAGQRTDPFMPVSWLFAGVVLLTGNFSWKKEGKGASLLQRGFSLLDSCSYSIYLVHAAVLDAVAMLAAHVPLSGPAVLGLTVFLTAAGCLGARYLVERPAQKLGRRLVDAVRI